MIPPHPPPPPPQNTPPDKIGQNKHYEHRRPGAIWTGVGHLGRRCSAPRRADARRRPGDRCLCARALHRSVPRQRRRVVRAIAPLHQRCCHNLHPTLANVEQVGQVSVKIGRQRVGQSLAAVRPSSVDLGPNLARIAKHGDTFGNIWPKLDRISTPGETVEQLFSTFGVTWISPSSPRATSKTHGGAT